MNSRRARPNKYRQWNENQNQGLPFFSASRRAELNFLVSRFYFFIDQPEAECPLEPKPPRPTLDEPMALPDPEREDAGDDMPDDPPR